MQGKKKNQLSRGQILIPNHLSEEEKEYVLDMVQMMEQVNPSWKDDYILVDEINGDINIKWFFPNYVEDMARKAKTTTREVLLFIMREQNKRTNN